MNIAKTIVGDSLAGTREIIAETKDIFGLVPIRRPDPNNETVNNALKSTSKVHVFQHRRLLGGKFGRLLFYGFEPIIMDSTSTTSTSTTSSSEQEDNNMNSKNNSTEAVKEGKGIILYPGTLVDVRAYAPIAHRMAENGYYAAIVTPPLSLAVADADLANDVIEFKGWGTKQGGGGGGGGKQQPVVDITSWVVSGHSQGGAFASIFAAKNRNLECLKGVLLMGAYASSSFSLEDSNYKVTSIYGSEDGIALYEDVVVNGATKLPPNTKFVKIEGGNHTQFSYVAELQEGRGKVDGEASISVDEQQDIICREMLSLLSEI